jgi:hypothetical protein
MRKIILFLCVCFILGMTSFASGYNTFDVTTLSNGDKFYESVAAGDIQSCETPNGNEIVVAYGFNTSVNNSLFFSKLDSSGNFITRDKFMIDFSSYGYYQGKIVCENDSTYYFVASLLNSSSNYSTLSVLKINSSGSVVLQNTTQKQYSIIDFDAVVGNGINDNLQIVLSKTDKHYPNAFNLTTNSDLGVKYIRLFKSNLTTVGEYSLLSGFFSSASVASDGYNRLMMVYSNVSIAVGDGDTTDMYYDKISETGYSLLAHPVKINTRPVYERLGESANDVVVDSSSNVHAVFAENASDGILQIRYVKLSPSGTVLVNKYLINNAESGLFTLNMFLEINSSDVLTLYYGSRISVDIVNQPIYNQEVSYIKFNSIGTVSSSGKLSELNGYWLSGLGRAGGGSNDGTVLCPPIRGEVCTSTTNPYQGPEFSSSSPMIIILLLGLIVVIVLLLNRKGGN